MGSTVSAKGQTASNPKPGKGDKARPHALYDDLRSTCHFDAKLGVKCPPFRLIFVILIACELELLDYHRLRHEEEASWDCAQLAREAGGAFITAAEPLLPTHDEPWAPHKLVRFTREPWFDRCIELCDLYGAATPVQRTWLRARIDRKIGGKMGLFALRASILGARQHDPALARAALIAYAIADLVEGDIRDTLIGLSLIAHCATLSGAGTPALFQEVAAMAGPALNILYREWAAGSISPIGSMGWKQVEAEDGIGFTM